MCCVALYNVIVVMWCGVCVWGGGGGGGAGGAWVGGCLGGEHTCD